MSIVLTFVKMLVFALVIGVSQMFLGHWLGVHDGLEHMQFTHTYQYVMEAAFYTVAWFLLFCFLVDLEIKDEKETKFKMKFYAELIKTKRIKNDIG